MDITGLEQEADMSDLLKQCIIDDINMPIQNKIEAGCHKTCKFLMLPMDGTGHVLNLLGFAYTLLNRNHSAVFAVSQPFCKYLKDTPFKAIPLNDPGFAGVSDPQERFAKSTLAHSVNFPNNSYKQIDMQAEFYNEFVTTVMDVNDQIAKIIAEEMPDFILVDYYVTIPAVLVSNIPWANVVSCNPLCIYTFLEHSDNLDGPPMYSGYGFGTDKDKWKTFKKAFDEAIESAVNRLQDFCKSRQFEIPKGKLWIPSRYCNFYVYPYELDYLEISKSPPKLWLRIDHFIRPDNLQELGVVWTRLKNNEKKIYFTLGSMGSADANLMNNLLKMFGNMPYQFIVSTGPNHAQIKLPDNAIGGKFINQLKIIPKVDCVIFHGGNNTLIDCCFHGKPMIILPLFGDQFDNATRIVDKKLGYSFRPYEAKEDLLRKAIDDLLADVELKERLGMMAQRMKNSRTHLKASVAIETIVKGKPIW